MEQLSGLDNLLYMSESPKIPLNLTALFIYDTATTMTGTVAFSQFSRLMNSLAEDVLPILKCKALPLPFMIDNPYWIKDENFNIDYHLQRFALPKPSDWTALYEVCSRFHARPLERDSPLWQALLIEGLDKVAGVPRGSVAVLIKIHHCVVDGGSAIKLFSALHTWQPEPGAPLISASLELQKVDFSVPTFWQKYRNAYQRTVQTPIKLVKSVTKLSTNFMALPAKLGREAANVKNHTPPKTVFNKMPSADRVVGHIRIPMKTFKNIQSTTSATLNEIALCVIAGAMRSYLSKQHELPTESLIAGMPINVRGKDEIKLQGNHISFANLSLFTDIADSKERLERIHEKSKAKKKINSLIGRQSMMSIINGFYPAFLNWICGQLGNATLMEKLPVLNNTIITNVPGMPKPVYLCGAKLIDYLGFGPLVPTISLFHVISSLPSHINITFISCENSMAHAEEYRLALVESYEKLAAAFELAFDKTPEAGISDH